MIKLIITSNFSHTTSQCFEHYPIIIGGKNSTVANLKLDIPALNDCHLQIINQKSENREDGPKICYYIINSANDPFSTLNGLPFGKQPIENHDVIQVHDVSIQFEIESFDVPFNAPDRIRKNELSFGALSEEAEKKVPELSLSQQSTLLSEPSPVQTLPKQPKMSLKDYYLSEYDEDNQLLCAGDPIQRSPFTGQMSKRLRILGLIAASLAFFLCGFAAFAYFWVSDQSDEEEIKAARGVADVAMALAYAGLKNIQPQNQNLSYHEFLKNNLHAIIEPNSSPSAEFDSHGQFSNCPYMLRIHTNNDLSQCLIIAQPAPSLLQWITPKASIVIDSLSMQLRKIKDIKALNRLIANTNLEGGHDLEISNLVKQGTLIPLADLGADEENAAFKPPRMLELVRPGAENLVYNAPRYYLLGEAILETSLNMMDHYTAPGDVQMLRQELKALVQYPDLILYSSEGVQNAFESQKALAAIAPKDNFLIGYLKFTQKGMIAGAELITENATPGNTIAEKETESNYEDGFEGLIMSSTHNSETDDKKVDELNKKIDTTDPLFLHLTAMAANRHRVLKPLTEEMIESLKKELIAPQSEFASQFAKTQKKYINLNKEELSKFEKKFESIGNEYAYLPASTLMDYIKEANMDAAFQGYLKKLSRNLNRELVTEDNISEQMKNVEKSSNWQELESAVVQANQLLCFENIPDYKRLISSQNALKLAVTQKLNQFILSSDSSLPSRDFSSEYLHTLSNILKKSWIIDPETYNFYVDEFELREPQI